jgi:predicted glutamine amidotransferase
MCVAIIVPEGADVPDLATLEACEGQNPHGGGVAWLKGGKVRWKKGLSAKEAHALVVALPGPHFIHFRIATVGGKTDELTHPFPISERAETAVEGSADAVLMHNGTWDAWQEHMLRLLRGKVPDGDWSDSRAMAYLAHHYGDNILSLIDDGRIAVLRRDGSIRTWGHWEREGGCLYSNLHWQLRARSSRVGYEMFPYAVQHWRETTQPTGEKVMTTGVTAAVSRLDIGLKDDWQPTSEEWAAMDDEERDFYREQWGIKPDELLDEDDEMRLFLDADFAAANAASGKR